MIRAGRMDVKVEYKLATRRQISQTFLRFFERQFTATVDNARPGNVRKDFPVLSDEEIVKLSETFATHVPEDTFSIAEVQGYLLTKKANAKGAAEDVAQWVQDQLDEKQKIKDLKEKKKRRKKEKRTEEKSEDVETKGNGPEAEKNGMIGKISDGCSSPDFSDGGSAGKT